MARSTESANASTGASAVVDCFRYICAWHGFTPEEVDRAIRVADHSSPKTVAAWAAELGLTVRVIKDRVEKLPRHGLAALLFAGEDGGAWVFDPALDDGGKFIRPTPNPTAPSPGVAQGTPRESFTVTGAETATVQRESLGWAMLFLPPNFSATGDWGTGETGEQTRGWFWSAVFTNRGDGIYILSASILINLFAIAMPLFTRSVYDRVIPNNALETLWVLVAGMGIIFCFDFVTRMLRGRFVDVAGKGIDHVLAKRVYHHSLSIDLKARPASAGSFASNLRGYEMVREFLGAATVLAMVDVPISLTMIGIVFWLAGPVGWMPVVAAVAVLAVSLGVQPFLRRLMKDSYARSVHRQALMVETANGIETVKAANAEAALENKMAHVVSIAEETDLKMRRITQFGMSFTAFCINGASIAVIVGSVYRIQTHEMTMGGLIACSMVVSRALTPLNGISSLLLRLQQTLSALEGLNTVMKMPREDARAVLRKPIRYPEFQFKNVTFTYPRQPVPSLQGVSLRIAPGERVGVIGRAGAGKSTLLRLLARLYVASEGLVLLDGVDISQWPGQVVRAKSVYLPQDGTLFHGTVRENIMLGNPQAGDTAMLEAAQAACVLDWVNSHPLGFDRPIGEHGILVSGGQRQSILLARCFLNQPDVLLLDEPSDGFDLTTEKRFREHTAAFLQADKRRTLVLSTHKPSLLQLVDRLILLDGGRVLADGPRDKVLELLQSGGKPPPDGGGRTVKPGTPVAAAAAPEPTLTM